MKNEHSNNARLDAVQYSSDNAYIGILVEQIIAQSHLFIYPIPKTNL